MSVLLKRRAKLETVTLERFDALDGQGAPSYESTVTFEARVEERDTVVRGADAGAHYVIGPDGTEVRTPLTLYVPGDESNVPAQRDRVTVGGSKYIAMEATPVRGLRASRSEPSFTRVRCADE